MHFESVGSGFGFARKSGFLQVVDLSLGIANNGAQIQPSTGPYPHYLTLKAPDVLGIPLQAPAVNHTLLTR